MDLEISVTAQPDQSDVDIIDKNLALYNDLTVGPADRQLLSVLVRDASQALIAGLNGYTAWGWLYIQRLWVGEAARGQGVAGKMLAAAEREAATRGCHSAYIDTFNPAALSAYQRQGYAEFGRMAKFVADRDRIFLQKKLG